MHFKLPIFFGMDEGTDKINNNNEITCALSPEVSKNFSWYINITVIDLSERNINSLEDNIQFPENLSELNLSHNKLLEVPSIVLKLKNLKTLNLSHNLIEFFDDSPDFCHNLERLDLSTNKLLGPPYWIWTEKPKNLKWVDLSCNVDIAKSFFNGYLEELLQHTTLVQEIYLHNCGLTSNHEELLSTFVNTKAIHFGIDKYCFRGANVLGEIPSKGLRMCWFLEKLNLSNTHIHTINPSIAILINIKELNLSCNNINGLPSEFCDLANLETCILSSNNILYLPDEMYKLAKLLKLSLDSNKLCMLPEKLLKLPNLRILDLYDNHLNEIQEDYSHLLQIDLAQNYLEESKDVEYLVKKERLRKFYDKRYDGSKPDPTERQDDVSSTTSEDEDYYRTFYSSDNVNMEPELTVEIGALERSSSPEDWDSDSHWIPHDIPLAPAPHMWEHFVHKKMREGNFCPGDAHVAPISEQVMFQKKLYPKVEIESIGQFDDYSSDDS